MACGEGQEPCVYEWDVVTGRPRHEVKLGEDITPLGLALHPDSKTMAVSDYGNRNNRNFSGRVLLLERGTGKVVRELPTPGMPASRVSFSPDGRWLAVAARVGVHVWDLQTGAEVAPGAAGHQGAIMQIATAPGGLIATASDDHTVRLWDSATGAERRRLQHGHWVRAVAVSPDGRRLATSSLDNTVRLWDTQSGKEIFKLPGHGAHGGYRAVGFRAGGGRLLSWGDGQELRVWDVKTGKLVAKHAIGSTGEAEIEKGQPAARERRLDGRDDGSVGLSPDGQHLIAPMNGGFQIIETTTGRIEHSAEHPGGPFHLVDRRLSRRPPLRHERVGQGHREEVAGWTDPEHDARRPPRLRVRAGERQADPRVDDADVGVGSGGLLARRQAPGRRLRPEPRRGALARRGHAGAGRDDGRSSARARTPWPSRRT